MLIPRSIGVSVRATSKVLQSVRTNSEKKPSKFNDLNSLCSQESTSSDGSLLAVPYKDFDVLISDIDEKELDEIGAANHIENLSIGSFSSTPFPVLGRVHGRNLRLMAPLVCQNVEAGNSKIFNVWFLVNCGSPYTCLTVKSLEKLVGHGFSHQLHNIAIQDPERYIECHISKTDFANVNILGMDAIQQLELSIDFNWKVSKNTFYLVRK
ncbi:unnamed protein product [Caenorhabditis auriculariae]|uniref:Uncharacterized protein n=1 Tax=Caenorhabditis auriculariae TaxID=2777116 RepID=A0A8S1GXY9_9PELO|nr:unnamed protein product [Caenorhabditis auriculariae]